MLVALPPKKERFGHTDSVTSVAITPDGEFAIASRADGTIRVWETMTGGLADRSRNRSSERPSEVRVIGESATVVSADHGGLIRVWGLDSQTDLHRLDELGLDVDALAVNSDGRIIVFSVRDDLAMRIWAPGSGNAYWKLDGHEGKIEAIAIRADGRVAASDSADRTVRLWDVDARACVGVLRGHEHEVRSVSFGPDGKTLVSGGLDGTVRMWDLTSHAPPRDLLRRGSGTGSLAHRLERPLCVRHPGWPGSVPLAQSIAEHLPGPHGLDTKARRGGPSEMFEEPPARSPAQQSVWLLFQAENRVLARDFEKALALVARCSEYSIARENLRAVCYLRQGRYDQALDVMRSLCLRGRSSVELADDLPLAVKVNFATALVAAGERSGGEHVLDEIGNEIEPGVHGCEPRSGGGRAG